MIKKYLFVIFFLFFSTKLWAWDATGHQIIAEIAYKHLNSQAKAEVDYYTDLLDKRNPPEKRFLRASVWADYIKTRDVTAYNTWHYIDLPFSADGTALQPNAAQNVVWAIDQCKQVLHSNKPNRFQKAEFLRFLMHFVGDIEQPLHAASLYSHHHPQGDHGGNLYKIQSEYANNLHMYWDKGLGLYPHHLRYPEVLQLADKIEKDYPISYFDNQLKLTNPKDWAKESFQLAKDFAYSVIEGSEPSNDYQTKGQKIVEQRLALAGYRLAQVLNTLLPPVGEGTRRVDEGNITH